MKDNAYIRPEYTNFEMEWLLWDSNGGIIKRIGLFNLKIDKLKFINEINL